MCDRNKFGRDFDAPPHQGDGAIIVPVNLAACPGFYNYFVVSLLLVNDLTGMLSVGRIPTSKRALSKIQFPSTWD